MRLRLRSEIQSVCVILVMLAGCKDENNPLVGGSPSDVIFPVRDVSYAAHVQPLFNQACALSGCHNDAVPSGSLKLTSYDHLMYDLLGIVVRGKPEESVLVLRIEGSVGQRMPPGEAPLNQNQINGIRTWITEGANNN
jgi:hypothetical protein